MSPRAHPLPEGSPPVGRRVLTLDGHETRVAHDAPTTLRMAAEFLPDIAVLDIGLPVMDGYELASNLRAIPGLAALRLIALTGYSQESDRRKSQEAGFYHYLVKPVDIDALKAVINAGGSHGPQHPISHFK